MSESRVYEQLRLILDPLFNGIVITGFGCGIYTLIVVQAIWMLHRKGNKIFYALALVFLWISTIIRFVSDWEIMRAAFVVNNGSLISIFNGFVAASRVLQNVASLLSILTADAILIWRCIILWQNRYVSTLLVTLFITTGGFFIWHHVATGVDATLASSIASLASAMTTATATLLIVVKIVVVTRKSPMRATYTNIITILLESGALVSGILICAAVPEFISFFHPVHLLTTSGKFLYESAEYLGAIQTPILGIGPTLIAFRIAGEPSEIKANVTSRSNPLSRLTFRRTARATTSDSQARGAHTSTIQFGLSHVGEDVSSAQTDPDVEAQVRNLAEEEQRDCTEKIGSPTGISTEAAT